jgi:hypothetical protein
MMHEVLTCPACMAFWLSAGRLSEEVLSLAGRARFCRMEGAGVWCVMGVHVAMHCERLHVRSCRGTLLGMPTGRSAHVEGEVLCRSEHRLLARQEEFFPREKPCGTTTYRAAP